VDTKAEKRKENAAKENGAAETASPVPESKPTTDKATEKKSVPNAIHLVRRADYLSEWNSLGEKSVAVTHLVYLDRRGHQGIRGELCAVPGATGSRETTRFRI